MSIRQLQQLGRAREGTAPPPGKKKLAQYEDFDLGDWAGGLDDISDGEDQKFGLKADRDFGSKSNKPKFEEDDEGERGFGGFDDEDEDEFGLDDQEVDPSDLDDDFGAIRYGDKPAANKDDPKKKPSKPEFSDDDDDFGAKDAGNIKLDDDTPPPEPPKAAGLGRGPNHSESADAIDFDLGAAMKEAKNEGERLKQRQKDEDQAERLRLEQIWKDNELQRKVQDDADKDELLKKLTDKIDKSLQQSKDAENTSGIKAKDDSAGGMSDYLKGFLGEMGSKSPIRGIDRQPSNGNEFNRMLENTDEDGLGGEFSNVDDKKSFEEFDVGKKFADLEDSEPIRPQKVTSKEPAARSNSNADQLDLLKDLNSRMNGSKDASSNPFDMPQQLSDPEQAMLVEDNDANLEIEEEDSADRNLDNFLQAEEISKEDPKRQNFLTDLSKEMPKAKKTTQKVPQNLTKPPVKTGKNFSQGSSFNNMSRGSSVLEDRNPHGGQKKWVAGPESKLSVQPSQQFQPHSKMSAIGKIKIVKDDSEIEKIVRLLRAELDQKEIEIVKLETQLESALNQRTEAERNSTELRKDKAKLQADKEELVSRLDLVLKQVGLLELDKKVLQNDNIQKTRLLKDRQEMTERAFVNSALENQKRIYEAEIEARNLKIDMLQNQMSALSDKLKLIQAAKSTGSRGFANHDEVPVAAQTAYAAGRSQPNIFPSTDGTVAVLKHRILELEGRLQAKQAFQDRQLPSSYSSGFEAKQTHFSPSKQEEEVLGMLVKGLTRENERVVKDLNNLRKAAVQGKTSGSNFNPDIKNSAAGNEEHLATISRLQDELKKKDEYFRNQLAKYQEKAQLTETAEAAAAKARTDLLQLSEEKGALVDQVRQLEDKLSRREQALAEARVERDVSDKDLREALRIQDE